LDDKMHKNSKTVEIYVELSNAISLGMFLKQVRGLELEVDSIQLDYEGALSENGRAYIALLKAPKRVNHALIVDDISQIPGVLHLEEL